MDLSKESTVYWSSSLDKHRCGYCKNESGNISHGMWAHNLTVEDYQNLIDRGWRRSGNYCYKPVMNEICCPMYTIKCEALNFQLSKSQKKVIKKFNKFLKDGGELKKSVSFPEDCSESASQFMHQEIPRGLFDQKPITSEKMDEVDFSKNEQIANSASCDIQMTSETSGVKNDEKSNKSKGADPSKPPCKKAKVLRLERKKEKLAKKGVTLMKEVKHESQKSLEVFLNEVGNTDRHKLKITLERIDEEHRHFQKTYDLFVKYQISIHNETPDDCSEFQYVNFLIETPLQYVKFSNESEVGYGSFHQLYWLDDKLIAVGVIDILPKCVSAVYFFYDPDYRDLTLGTYGSLREVELVRQLHEKVPSIENYYMGFYIHSCPKMRYKGKLTPSYLLCPETYHWVTMEKSVPKLENQKYSRLDDREGATDEDSCPPCDTDIMKIVINRRLMYLKQYKKMDGNDREMFNEIGKLVGKKCVKKLIFIMAGH